MNADKINHMPNKTKSKKTKKTSNESVSLVRFVDSPLSPNIKIILSILVIIFIAWLLFFRGGERYSVSTNEVKYRINTVLNQTDIQGKQLASKTIDKGCKSGGTGLQTSDDCFLEGYKYFELGEDKKTALHSLDSKLKSLEFQRSKSYNEENTNQILSGEKEGDVYYLNRHTSVRIGWSTLPTAGVNGPGSTAISQALSLHRIKDVSHPTTVVGVVVSEVYWDCTSEALDIMGLTCIFPPHEPDVWSEV